MRRLHKISILTIAIGATLAPFAQAHTMGTLYLAGNIALTDTKLTHNFTTHEVDEVGIGFGFILPITRHRFALSYKGSVAFHGVTDIIHSSNPAPDDDKFYRNLDQYIGSANELTVGTKLRVSDSIYLEPLLGVGVLVHIIYGNQGEGIAYGSFQTDLTTLAMYEMHRFDIGAMVSFAYVPWGGYFDTWNSAYVSVGLAVSK
jgi:hypothetical protein